MWEPPILANLGASTGYLYLLVVVGLTAVEVAVVAELAAVVVSVEVLVVVAAVMELVMAEVVELCSSTGLGE
jgi:hypothetical protein